MQNDLLIGKKGIERVRKLQTAHERELCLCFVRVDAKKNFNQATSKMEQPYRQKPLPPSHPFRTPQVLPPLPTP